MCGIVGVINRRAGNSCIDKVLTSMMMMQTHRGPDDDGKVFWNWNGDLSEIETTNCMLDGAWGFNRLSIRDTTNNGHQPMLNSEKSVIICFNGEIYNIDELLCKVKSHHFVSSTDTEVILALYEEVGLDEMLRLLNGMFSIVLTDLRERKVYFIRDRMGIKPLYYYNSFKHFLVASEIKSIVNSGIYNIKVDDDSLYEYFIFRNITQNRTLFSDIYSFEPGTVYCLDEDGIITSKKYFSLNEYHRDVSIPYPRYKEMLDTTITSSVGRQLVSDVTLGTQLSGGIDSSLVAYKMVFNDIYKRDSVSIVFPEKDYTEDRYIDVVTKEIGVSSNKIPFGVEDFLKYFETTIWHMESMLPHSNCMGLYKLCRHAKLNHTVLLSGEGADELFGGYSQFVELYRRNEKQLDKIDYDPYMIDYAFGSNKTEIIQIMNGVDRFDHFVNIRKAIIDGFQGNIIDKQIKYELSTYLPELLIRQDKMSMASSVENRVPLLDNEVIDCALISPVTYLFRKRVSFINNKYEGKYVLKDIARDRFGRRFAFRNKMGFAMPVNDYLSNKSFLEYYRETIRPGLLKRDFINGCYIDMCINDIMRGKAINLDMVWRAISFEVWYQLFVEGRSPQSIIPA